MATSARRHTVPAPGETPRRQALNDLAASINDAVPVANATERAQVLADLAAQIPPYVPSPARPLLVHRTDAPAGCRYEYTADGLTWRILHMDSAPTPITLEGNWALNVRLPHVRRMGDMVELLPGRIQRVTGSPAAVTAGAALRFGTAPAGMTPSVTEIFPATVHLGSAIPTLAEIRIDSGGEMYLISAAAGTLAGGGGTSYIVVPSGRWPAT